MADDAHWADADLSIDANAFGCVLNGNNSCAWVTRQALACRGTKKNRGPGGSPRRANHGTHAVSRIQGLLQHLITRAGGWEPWGSAWSNCRKKLVGLDLGRKAMEEKLVAGCWLLVAGPGTGCL